MDPLQPAYDGDLDRLAASAGILNGFLIGVSIWLGIANVWLLLR